MNHDYRRYIGVSYAPPHGCFKLLEAIFRECYGWDVSGMYPDLDDANQRVARLHECIARYARPVAVPAEGDVVLIRAMPWHVGVVIEPPYMLHQFLSGHSAQSDYTSSKYWPRVVGFYRYRPAHDG